MIHRVASIRWSFRFVAISTLTVALASPAWLPPPSLAEEINSEGDRDVSRRSAYFVPDVGRTGDDDQPTIGGRRQGREAATSFNNGAQITPAERPDQPAPQTQPRAWSVRWFVQWFMMRLGVMLR
jgi:hypothetical protein